MDPLPVKSTPIPRFSAEVRDELLAAIDYLKRKQPVVITNSHIVDSSEKWTPEYLKKHMGNKVPFHVFHSKTKNFLFWDEKRDAGVYEFEVPTMRNQMTMTEFIDNCLSHPPGEPDAAGYCYHYLQQILIDGVGEKIVEDFKDWDWVKVTQLRMFASFGDLTTNMVFLGQAGVVTPCHFDEQHNLFIQVHGRKRFILFDAEDFGALYPYPLHHAHDRQSQVNIFNPDFERFPRFRDAVAHEVILQPGELLYIPSYWWHHVISIDQTLSVNFWCRNVQGGKLSLPLSGIENVCLRRNLETLIGDSIGGANVPSLFEAILSRNIPPHLQTHADALRQLLEQVGISGENAITFVDEWSSGRFNNFKLREPQPPLQTPLLAAASKAIAAGGGSSGASIATGLRYSSDEREKKK